MLVEKYAKQYELVESAEEELGKIKQALIDFAVKEDLSVVMGKDYRVNVKLENKPHFPTKSEKGREELEKIVKSMGKWDEVSDLNTGELLKSYRNWEKDIVEKIGKYLTKSRKQSIGRPCRLISDM